MNDRGLGIAPVRFRSFRFGSLAGIQAFRYFQREQRALKEQARGESADMRRSREEVTLPPASHPIISWRTTQATSSHMTLIQRLIPQVVVMILLPTEAQRERADDRADRAACADHRHCCPADQPPIAASAAA